MPTGGSKEKKTCGCGAIFQERHTWSHEKNSKQHKEWAARQTMNIYEVNAAHQQKVREMTLKDGAVVKSSKPFTDNGDGSITVSGQPGEEFGLSITGGQPIKLPKPGDVPEFDLKPEPVDLMKIEREDNPFRHIHPDMMAQASAPGVKITVLDSGLPAGHPLESEPIVDNYGHSNPIPPHLPICDHTEIPNGTRCNKCEKMVWKRMGRSRG